MNDLIFRQDAIKCCRNEWEEEVEERLRLLPSAQQWIPCSERLPKNENSVLVTTSIGEVTDGEYWHKEQIWVKGFLRMEVTAWMPLPQPWKGETDEQIH